MPATDKDDRPAPAEAQKVVSQTAARQGVAPHQLRYMLGFGLVGVILAFAAIYFLLFAH